MKRLILDIKCCDECPMTDCNFDHGHDITEIEYIPKGWRNSEMDSLYGDICSHKNSPKFPKNYINIDGVSPSFGQSPLLTPNKDVKEFIQYYNIEIFDVTESFPSWCPLEDVNENKT